jgi:hypothetical protein
MCASEFVYVCVRACMCAHAWMCVYVCICVCVHVCVRVRVNARACVCARACMCACVRACVPFSTFKKIGMKFIPLSLTQPQNFKLPTIANDMEDSQTIVVGTTTAPPSTGPRNNARQ